MPESLVKVEECGLLEDLPALRTDVGQVDEEAFIVDEGLASLQFFHGVEAQPPGERTHPATPMSDRPGVT